VIDEKEPKYINGSRSLVYDKTKALYGLFEAQMKCRGRVFLVEGYFDVLTMVSNGIGNAVSVCGTNLSTEHLKALKDCAREVVFAYDADAAGNFAVKRAMPLCLAQNVRARVMELPEGYDPDSFIREKGPEAFMDLAAKSRNPF